MSKHVVVLLVCTTEVDDIIFQQLILLIGLKWSLTICLSLFPYLYIQTWPQKITETS